MLVTVFFYKHEFSVYMSLATLRLK